MKKNYAFKCFLIIFLLISCEKEELVSLENTSERIETRASVPDPIGQIQGIDLYIRQRAGDVSNVPMYLTGHANNGSVFLSQFQENNGRQIWKIKYETIILGGFTEMSIMMKQKDLSNRAYLVDNRYINNPKPVIQEVTFFDDSRAWNIKPANRNSCYNITQGFSSTLHANGYNSTTVNLTRDIIWNLNYTEWEIIPAEEFEIIGITYDKLTGDVVVPNDMSLRIKWLENNTAYPAERTITFEETLTNKSKFSETKGLKTTISHEVKVGIPVFNSGGITSQITNETTHSFTAETETTEVKRFSETITQTVPAYTSIKATLFATQYNADVTYTVTLKGLNSERILNLQGKWKGLVVQEERIILSDTNNNVIKTINLR